MAVFSGNGSAAAPSITFSSDTDTGIFRPDANSLEIVSSGGKSRARFSPSEAVFNNDSQNCNFRVKSVSQSNILFVEASDNRVGIGTDTPATRLEVRASSNAVSGGTTPVAIRISDNGSDGGAGTWNTTSDFAQLQFFSFDGSAPGGSNVRGSIGAVMENSTGGTSALSFSSFSGGTPTPRVRLTSSGSLLIGGTLPSAPNATIASNGSISCTALRGPTTSFAADGNWHDVIPSTFSNGAWWITANVSASGYNHTMIAVATLSFGDGDFNILCNSNYNSQTQPVISLQWTPSTLNGSQTLQIKTAANVPSSSANFKVISVL